MFSTGAAAPDMHPAVFSESSPLWNAPSAPSFSLTLPREHSHHLRLFPLFSPMARTSPSKTFAFLTCHQLFPFYVTVYLLYWGLNPARECPTRMNLFSPYMSSVNVKLNIKTELLPRSRFIQSPCSGCPTKRWCDQWDGAILWAAGGRNHITYWFQETVMTWLKFLCVPFC